MKAHEQILKMIDEVSPDDTAKLDEIDRLVDEYEWNGVSQLVCPPQYTRSRDALKAIRPEGWKITTHQHCEGHFTVFLDNYKYRTFSYTLPTEELAELHAIIQAIAYEREE